MTTKDHYKDILAPLVHAALHSPGLLAPNEFNLARYSLNVKARNQLLDPDILALEDFLIDNIGLPDNELNVNMLHAFGDVVYDTCTDDSLPLNIGYQQMLWLLTWINTHHPPSFFGEDPDSPFQALQLASAVGYGEWAATYNQIEEGLAYLFDMANSPLWRVRDASAWGLHRMLHHAWTRTIRRFRYQTMIANTPEWRAMMLAWQLNPEAIIGDAPIRLLDLIELTQGALRYIMGNSDDLSADEHYQILRQVMDKSMMPFITINPTLGFNQMGCWALWDSAEVRDIVHTNLSTIHRQTNANTWDEQVNWVASQLALFDQ